MIEQSLTKIVLKTERKKGLELLNEFCNSLKEETGAAHIIIAESDKISSYFEIITSSFPYIEDKEKIKFSQTFFKNEKMLKNEEMIPINELQDNEYTIYSKPLPNHKECHNVLIMIGKKEKLNSNSFLLLKTFSNHIASEIEYIEKQNEQYNQEFFDPLTKLPNRFSLTNKLEAIKSKKTYNSVLFIDIDYFKTINDSLGHLFGDMLLKRFSQIVSFYTNGDCELFRMGSDDFALVIYQNSSDFERVIEKAEEYSQKLIDIFSSPIEIDFHELIIGLSIGICVFSQQDSIEDIIRHGDISLNYAKNSGRNTFRVYTPEMQENSHQKIFLKNELVKSIHQDNLEIHLQPQINSEREIYGAEALIRWQFNGQYIPPIDFIPLAEETGLIKHIGSIVLEKTCRFIKENRHLLPTSFRKFSINVSPIEFYQPNFVSNFIAIFEKFDIPASFLEIELTENVFFKERYESIKKMHQLLDRGFTFAIDDFGTGYSSLSYLVELPFNKLKIDKSFIHKIHESTRYQRLVESIINICNHMELDVIAEGVENEKDLVFLQENSCQLFQGFYFSKPIPCQDFKEKYLSKKDDL